MKLRRPLSRFATAIVPVTCTIASLPAPATANDLASIKLEAEFLTLKPDGRSTSVISARVYDERGNLAAEGTRVRFTTTAGRLDASVATTRNGVARVVLTAGEQPGEAIILATLDAGNSIPARLNVQFTSDADNTESGTAYIRINGTRYIGYAPNSATIQANGPGGGASFAFRSVTISATALQYNLRENGIIARGNVTVDVAGVTQKYDNLRFSFVAGTGVAEQIVDGQVTAYTLTGPRLTPKAFEKGRFLPPSDTWQLADLSGAPVTVVARSLLIEPNTRIQFRRVTFYIDGAKAFSAPLHVMELGRDSIFSEQIVGVGPQGLTVDLPVYYQADPKGIGTVNVRRAARLGSSAYAVRPGWTLDLNQSYNGRNNQTGVFEINGLNREDWGMRLRHNQRVARHLTGNAFVDFPNHRSLFLTTQLTRTFETFYLNGTLAASRNPGFFDPVTQTDIKANGDFRQQLFAETNARKFLNQPYLQYTFNGGVGQQTLFGNAATSGIVRTESFATRVFTDPLKVGWQRTVSQTVSVGQAWVQGTRKGLNTAPSGMTLLGTTTLSQQLPKLGSFSLAYDYTQTPLATGISAASANGRHRASLNAYLEQGNQWSLSLDGSQGLDTDQSSLFGILNFRLQGPWRGRVMLSESRFSGFRTREVEYALIRRISGRDIAVYYSTTTRRFQFDLAGARF